MNEWKGASSLQCHQLKCLIESMCNELCWKSPLYCATMANWVHHSIKGISARDYWLTREINMKKNGLNAKAAMSKCIMGLLIWDEMLYLKCNSVQNQIKSRRWTTSTSYKLHFVIDAVIIGKKVHIYIALARAVCTQRYIIIIISISIGMVHKKCTLCG